MAAMTFIVGLVDHGRFVQRKMILASLPYLSGGVKNKYLYLLLILYDVTLNFTQWLNVTGSSPYLHFWTKAVKSEHTAGL